ncbi:hypothetical protein [Noviherbaspirillum pedocola]|uniref:Uncharacterized protein n=1 Tax=Noviherbaspirillum pedocola TaxID=2801341 RepID=A0A934SX69_9BURK|nr:hypothetical protein [Noviherbaspirillum pedocola]MBK4737407.1 hypothetical protein [Noviherbaspirillum pedocola]
MPNPLDSGIRISSWHRDTHSPDERLDLLRRMEKLNDGSACFVERDVNTASNYHVRKRTLWDWCREGIAQIKAELGDVEDLEDLKSARAAAMNALSRALGLYVDDGLKQRIREADQKTNFKLADVSSVIAPETLDLSNKSLLISGFESFGEKRRLRRMHELNRLVEDGKGPLRVDLVKDVSGKALTYVRTRSLKEAFFEFWMSGKKRREIENAARQAITRALNPFVEQSQKLGMKPPADQAMQRSEKSEKPPVCDVDRALAWVTRIKDAVLD